MGGGAILNKTPKKLWFAAFFLVAIAVYLGWSYWQSVDLDNRSDAFERRLDAQLAKSTALPAEFLPLLDEWTSQHVAAVCVIPPYVDEIKVGQLASANLGDDISWLGGPTEQWLGMVLLDHENEVIEILRLSHSRFRLVGSGTTATCYSPANRPKLLAETTNQCGDKGTPVCLRKIIVSTP
jgi:hypothetical protein